MGDDKLKDYDNVIQQMQKAIEKTQCDDDCVRSKKLSDLKKLLDHSEIYHNEKYLNISENAYYKLRDGVINNDKRFNDKYNAIGLKQQEMYNSKKNIILTNINNLKKILLSFNVSFNNVMNVIKFTINQNIKLKREIDEITSNINVNDRKYYYKKQYLKFKTYIKYFLSFLYFIFCLINLYFSDIKKTFFEKKLYFIGKILLMIIYLLIIYNIFYYI
jgi:hypothetical protein